MGRAAPPRPGPASEDRPRAAAERYHRARHRGGVPRSGPSRRPTAGGADSRRGCRWRARDQRQVAQHALHARQLRRHVRRRASAGRRAAHGRTPEGPSRASRIHRSQSSCSRRRSSNPPARASVADRTTTFDAPAGTELWRGSRVHHLVRGRRRQSAEQLAGGHRRRHSRRTPSRGPAASAAASCRASLRRRPDVVVVQERDPRPARPGDAGVPGGTDTARSRDAERPSTPAQPATARRGRTEPSSTTITSHRHPCWASADATAVRSRARGPWSGSRR